MASQDRGISGRGGRLPRVPAFHQPRWSHARLSWLQPLSLLPNWDEAMGVPSDGGQRDPPFLPGDLTALLAHSPRLPGKDVAQAAADGYRQDFNSFAALGSCSLTTAVPHRETGSPWDPPNPGLALPPPAESTARDGHLPKVLIWQHCQARTCSAIAGTCPVCTVVCDRMACAKLPLSSLTPPLLPLAPKQDTEGDRDE